MDCYNNFNFHSILYEGNLYLKMDKFISLSLGGLGPWEIILCGAVMLVPLGIVAAVIAFAKKDKKLPPKISSNSQLINCSVCGGKVSKNAKACPHCGEPNFLKC